ncbi:uncharacterized protein LOC117338236 [Pecten maximus]|uniref:uncharacterized protein LOC117338236 n=1 Tax=Pecten maximus TaxID=6579 RepID=UPI0014591B66|nr:uncharacterized protein LOC117338236 [Pecten maximus]
MVSIVMRYVFLSCVLFHVIAYVTAASVKANCGNHTHGDNWNHDTLTCLTYRCRDGTIYPKYTGCVKNDKCYDVDQKWQKDCSKFQCVSYKKGNMTFFETKLDMQCTVERTGKKSTCKPNGAKWKDNCDYKRCDVTTSQGYKAGNMQYSAQVINVKQGCKVGRKCYYDGDQWFKKCVWYTCKVTPLYTKAVSVPGCTHKKKCYKVGSSDRTKTSMAVTNTCVNRPIKQLDGQSSQVPVTIRESAGRVSPPGERTLPVWRRHV